MPINIQVKPCPSSEAGGGDKRDSRDFTNRSQWTMVTSFPSRQEEERGAQVPLRFFLTVMPLGELRQDIFANFIVKSLSYLLQHLNAGINHLNLSLCILINPASFLGVTEPRKLEKQQENSFCDL